LINFIEIVTSGNTIHGTEERIRHLSFPRGEITHEGEPLESSPYEQWLAWELSLLDPLLPFFNLNRHSFRRALCYFQPLEGAHTRTIGWHGMTAI
jgi:hypothetical protein